MCATTVFTRHTSCSVNFSLTLSMCSRALHGQVIAGAQNGTAYVINDCSEGFYYNGAAWILIAGPFDPGSAILASASEGAEGAGPQ